MAAGSKNIRLFRRAAEQRLVDAQFLREAGRSTGAVYLAGYCVECVLKALILAVVPAGREADVLRTFRGGAAHAYDHHQYQQEGGAPVPADVLRHFVRVNTWAVDMRYRPGTIEESEVRLFFESVTEVIRWADGRL